MAVTLHPTRLIASMPARFECEKLPVEAFEPLIVGGNDDFAADGGEGHRTQRRRRALGEDDPPPPEPTAAGECIRLQRASNPGLSGA
ncbi:hypothetical protein FXW78_49785 [Rhodococcus opacus]|nr:hypothetical protein [Rhodococcus opacus]